MPGDNQLSGAINVGLGSNLSGKVGKKDLDDLYRFSSTGGSSLDVSLSAIVPRKASKQIAKKTRVGVEIYKLKRSFDEVAGNVGNIDFSSLDAADISANFELIRSSRARSTKRASFAINPLDAGDYVIRVRQNKLEGKYRLSIGGTLIPDEPIITPDPIPTPAPTPDPTPIPTPTPTPSPFDGNSLATARPLEFPVTSQGGSVNDSDTQDFYSFSVPGAGDYKFNLSGLTADANVEILDSAGTLVKSATKTGSQAESLLLPLNAGSYYVRVFQGTGGAASSYGLSAALLTDNSPGTFAGGAGSATILTPTASLGVVKSNYVLDGAKNSTEDLFKINVTQRSFLNLELKGINNDGLLTGNLDVELFSADGFTPTPATVVFTSSRPGTSAEVFGGTLLPGEYYIRIKPGTAGTGEGSEYSLSMSLTPKNQVPTITRDINYGRTPIFDDNGILIGSTGKSSDAKDLTKIGGLAYFSASDGTGTGTATGLWKTDGTLKGTQQLKTFSGSVSNFTQAGGFLYFVGDNGSGEELWKSDGTAAGTSQVADLNPGSGSSSPIKLVAAGSRLYFLAKTTNIESRKLHRTNATGTSIELVPGSGTAFSEVDNLLFHDSTLFFSAAASSLEEELWTISNADNPTDSNDTLADPGTATAQNLNPATASSLPSGLVVSNGKLYAEVTKSGSRSLAEITKTGNIYGANPIATTSGLTNPRNFTTVGTTLYFSGSTNASGNELWRLNTNATDNTATLVDINAGGGGSNPTNLVKVGTSVYFFADNGTAGKGLWRDNGAGAPTQVSIADNTLLGTNPSDLIAIGDTVYFTADNAVKGKELWSYTTTTSTMKLLDINVQPNPATAGTTLPSNPARLTDIGGILYFIADNGLDGVEVMSL
jgi:ELWxxDGT repeat protein